MTMSDLGTRQSFSGNGSTTSFSFTFRALDATHVKAKHVAADGTSSDLTYGTDFSVSLNAGPGGSVTFPEGGSSYPTLPSGATLIVYRETPVTQPTDLENQGALLLESVEEALDRTVAMAQERDTDRSRSLRLDESDTATLSAIPVLDDGSEGDVLTLNSTKDGFNLQGIASSGSFTAGDGVELSGGILSLDIDGLSSGSPSAADSIPLWSDSLGQLIKATLASLTSPSGAIDGLIPSSAADDEHDITFTDGRCWNTARNAFATLASDLTKQADAAFAEGDAAGGMVSGHSMPNSGTVVALVATKDSDDTVDVCFNDLAGTGYPVAPSGWTVHREIGRFPTDSSGNFLKFYGHAFGGGAVKILHDDPPSERSSYGMGTTAINTVMTVPTGIKLFCIVNAYVDHPSVSGTGFVRLSDPDSQDLTPDGTNSQIQTSGGGTGTQATARQCEVMTDTSGQIRFRNNFNGASITMGTEGYILPRDL